MKKLLILLTVAMFAVNNSNAQTVQTHTKTATTAKTSKTSVHTKTEATPGIQVSVNTNTNTTPHRRAKHRTTKVSSTTHVKADGTENVIQNKTTTTTKKSKM
jgi:hypothetical protein